VRTGGAAGLAYVSDDLPACNVLAGHNGSRREVSVEGDEIVAMIEDYLPAISRAHVRIGYVAVACCAH